MILPALRWIVGAAQAVGEIAGTVVRFVRQARRGTLPNPSPGHDGETDPFPLSRRREQLIRDQIRSATEQRPEIRPPPRSSRYD